MRSFMTRPIIISAMAFLVIASGSERGYGQTVGFRVSNGQPKNKHLQKAPKTTAKVAIQKLEQLIFELNTKALKMEFDEANKAGDISEITFQQFEQLSTEIRAQLKQLRSAKYKLDNSDSARIERDMLGMNRMAAAVYSGFDNEKSYKDYCQVRKPIDSADRVNEFIRGKAKSLNGVDFEVEGKD
jgi:hypothetical protein